MSRIVFRTLGALDLRAADGRELHTLLAQPKRIALLAYLCIADPRGYHRRDTLLGLFWPDSDQEHARTSLRKSLHVLRRALGDDVILSRGDEEVAVNFDRISCDARLVKDFLLDLRYQDALAFYGGDLLPGFFIDDAPEFEHWLEEERQSMRELAGRSALGAALELQKQGDYAMAVKMASRAMDFGDKSEHTVRLLVNLHANAGDRAAAIKTYEEFAGSLAKAYGTEPSAETREQIELIRSGKFEPAKNGSAVRRVDPEFVQTPVHIVSPGLVDTKHNGARGRRGLIGVVALSIGSIIFGRTVLNTVVASQAPNRVVRFTLVVDSTEPLVRDQGFASRLAISPDGSRLAYISGSPNGPDRRILRIREWNDLHAVAIAGTEEAESPFFSPDGRTVGFLRQHSVWLASPTGGPPVQISDSLSGIAGASWGTDGFIYVDGFEFKPLARVEAKAGSAAKWFTVLDTLHGEVDHMWPDVLPNAKAVLFTVTISGRMRPDGQPSFAIALADIPSGKHRIIINDGSYPRYVRSGHLLYVNAKRVLMMVPFDQNSLSITGQPTPVLEGMRLGTYGATDLTVSSNGTLVYSLAPGLSRDLNELLWVSRDGKTTPVDPNWQGLLGNPEVSPDGKLLAIEKSIDGQGTDVWIKQLDRGPAIKLIHEGAYSGNPKWGPDGKTVTFAAVTLDGHSFLVTQRADGTGGAVRVPYGDRLGLFWPSPDWKWIIFDYERSDTRSDILGLRPGIDKQPVPLLTGEHYKVLPDISPDGHWLTYMSDETGLYQIYVVPFPNTKDGKWVVTTAGGIHPHWGRRGDEMFYRDTSGDFFSVPVRLSPTFSSGRPKHLLSAKRIEYPLSFYSVAPDDRLLVVRRLNWNATDKIVVVQNWFEELKRSSAGK